MNQYMKSAVCGVAIGDALGCPVQFESRAEVKRHPVTDMRGYGTFNLPEGSWTDDTSLTLAALASIKEKNGIDADDIMERFCDWMYDGAYTPYGFSYDIGNGTRNAINAYHNGADVYHCGSTAEYNNGNGSLMRIIPVCVWCALNVPDEKEAVKLIDLVSGLTHNTERAKTACGLYGFMVNALIHEEGSLKEKLQKGMDRGIAYYKAADTAELRTYHRLFDLDAFAKTQADRIESSGYVVDAFEAAVWSLITTNSFKEALLKAVNLGDDTDTVAAIAGGLGGLYYGLDAIPQNWLESLKNKELFENLLD